MTDQTDDYLMGNDPAELERLRLQARVFEPDSEAMLDLIGVQPGWNCIDLGCGALGIVGPLSSRVGPTGHVLGLDMDAKQLASAQAYVDEQGLSNVELMVGDAYDTGLPRESFDLVHVRFLFAPVGRDEELLREMLALARPGAVLAIQEPNFALSTCFPSRPGWERLQSAIVTEFARAGGDFNAGQRTYGMIRQLGLEDIGVRATVVAVPHGHPYRRMLVLFANTLRQRFLENGAFTEAELDEVVAECEQIAQDPDTFITTFMVTQVWGRKPG